MTDDKILDILDVPFPGYEGTPEEKVGFRYIFNRRTYTFLIGGLVGLGVFGGAFLAIKQKSLHDEREIRRINGIEEIISKLPEKEIIVGRDYRIWGNAQQIINETPELIGTDPNLIRMYIKGLNHGESPIAGRRYNVLLPRE